MDQSSPTPSASAGGYTHTVWVLAVLIALILLCYGKTITATAILLTDSEDMAHGFFAPFVAGAFLWMKKDKLSVSLAQPSIWSIPLIAAGAVLAIPASLGASTTISRFGMLLSLAGCVLALGGIPLLKLMRFPLALLFYTFPIPAVLYGEITLPLQLLASRLAEASFELIGYSVLREGNVIELPGLKLSVVEACSGLRSLITLSFFTAVYAYLLEEKNWIRILLFAGAIPSAILINALRITMTGVLGRINPEWTHGTVHDITGWVCFAIGFLNILLLHWITKRFTGKEKLA